MIYLSILDNMVLTSFTDVATTVKPPASFIFSRKMQCGVLQRSGDVDALDVSLQQRDIPR